MNKTHADPRIIVALDFPTAEAALVLARHLDPKLCRVKVGLELFSVGGPLVVESLQHLGFEVFLDLKFHDIPNTVDRAVRAAAALGVWMINVHALGGRRMLEAARSALEAAAPRPRLIAVTILTSHAEGELAEIAVGGTVSQNAERLARLAAQCGLDGVVCSPRESARLRLAHGPGFLLVTPGIRAGTDGPDDQRRTATAYEALKRGASHLVIGRPVTRAPDPAVALAAILKEIQQ